MVVENNVFERARAAVHLLDLSYYWYESGRIKNFTFRNNIMRGCSELGEESFILAGISGVPHTDAPKIHERIEISDNRFEGIRHHAIVASGIKELVMKNNSFDTEKDGLIIIDGENYPTR